MTCHTKQAAHTPPRNRRARAAPRPVLSPGPSLSPSRPLGPAPAMSAAPPSLTPSRPPRTTWPGRRSAAAHAPCPLPCPAESGALEQNGGGRSGAGRERAVLSGEDGGGERLREVRRRGQPRGDRRLGGGPGSVSRRQRGGGEIADAPAAGFPELGPAVPSAGCGQAPPAPASPLPDRSSAAVAGLVCGAPRPTGPPAAGSGPSGPEGIPVRICGSGLASASSRPPQCPLPAARAGVARRRWADPRRGVSESPHSGAVLRPVRERPRPLGAGLPSVCPPLRCPAAAPVAGAAL